MKKRKCGQCKYIKPRKGCALGFECHKDAELITYRQPNQKACGDFEERIRNEQAGNHCRV